MQFNKYIKECREQLQLTQEALVQELYNHHEVFAGFDVNTFSRWERGLSFPSIERQIKCIEVFQTLSGKILPFFDEVSKDSVEDEMCQVTLNNLFGNNKRLIMNFPSHAMEVDDIKISHLRHTKNIDYILNLSFSVIKGLAPKNMKLNLNYMRKLAYHPSNLFLICEYEEQFFGMLYVVRLKPEIFKKLINFEMKRDAIQENHIANFQEDGCSFIFAFYAYSDKASTLLFLRFYAHLIANRNVISKVGTNTIHDNGKKMTARLNLAQHIEVKQPQVTVTSHQANISKVLVNEYVLKMLFQKKS
jgi:transcriptional regulator with XRE-family HTH domain